MIKFIFLLQVFTCILPAGFGNAGLLKTERKVKGIILSSDNKQPVKDAYIFIVQGEEEAITNSRGEFEIVTWQNLPLNLSVQHSKFKETKLKVESTSQLITILLQSK